MQTNSPHIPINIALLCDNQTIAQSAVALYSLAHSKNKETIYRVFILCINLDSSIINHFRKLATASVALEIMIIDTHKYLPSQSKKPHDITLLSLCKLDLANLLPHIDKVLYIDSDSIIQKDLLPLYSFDIEKYYVAAVKEPVIYYWYNELYKNLADYFNTGVLLLNLKNLRRDTMPLKLLAKKTNPLNREDRDQDIFNILFENHVVFLDVTYNFLYTTFLENAKACSIKELNTHYKTHYDNLDAICKNTTIIHFASRYKPWKYRNMVFSHTWLQLYKKTPFANLPIPIQTDFFKGKHPLRATSFLESLKKRFKNR